ncbi:hypothetical protein [Nesterenkonia alkaliphila]|uniref:Uncharacterized protein n=1 Tax=Nesterenkonia alkaliphila TaxID=1463631 RepID=A0A7K1UKB9_9MICC|nr:hypothetical protein [Nesterenkonia alkaliphila]MVT26938.1 hypothetical protein [Nesterenkonia alkaliphila]GFZ90506.1 hypothetical protein GCM10011359_19900 [Nesterenkonia alkaliphila]
MEPNAAQTRTATRSLRRRALSACAAGATALGITLGAAAVPAQADVYEGLDEEMLDQLITQLLEELENGGEFPEILDQAAADDDDSPEDEEDQDAGLGFGSDSEGEDEGAGQGDLDQRPDRDEAEPEDGYSWILDEPMSGDDLVQALLEAEDLPENWEVDRQYVDEAYAQASDADDIQITEEGVVVGGPESEGYLNKDFSLTGFQVSAECEQAVQDFDDIREETEYLVILPVSVDGNFAMVALASTPVEHDLYSGYYSDIIEECGTSITQGPVSVEIEPYETFDGFSVEFSDGLSAEQVHIGGASFGHNHVFFVAEGDIDSEEIQGVVQAQIDALDEAVN